MKTVVEIAKEAHRKVCPMLNCVDCLFGVCRNDCDYQIQFEKELFRILENEQRNDNKRALQEM